MSNKVKDIDIKNRRYNFFNDNINIKNFDSNRIFLFTNILIDYIGHVTIIGYVRFELCKN